MKDQMQYIVIEGRKPQDGAKPTQALLILPKWISPTLACAGIVGRIIELTDGNVIEQGLLPCGEGELLENIREDAESQMETDDRHEQELRAGGVAAPAVRPTPGAAAAAQQRDDAYREGMQAMRSKVAELLLPFGMPSEAKVPNWLKEQLEELAQFRKDRPEMLVKLQAAEDNLDAWRNAAGAADLVQVCDVQTGRIKELIVQGVAVEQVTAQQRDVDMNLDTLCGAYGCTPGEDKLRWIHTKLNALIEAQGVISEQGREHDAEVEQLRTLLKGIRRMAKKGLR